MGGGKKPANIANPGNTPTAHASPSESSSAVVSAAAPPGLIMYTYMSFSESESGGDHGKEVKVKAKSNAKET